MGLRGWIRRWVGRHWCRDLAALREQVERAVNDRALLRTQAEQIVNLNETIRKLVQDRVRAIGATKDAEREFLAGVERDLQNIRQAHGLVGCRLDALVERMGLGVLAAEDGDDVEERGGAP